MGTDEEQLGVFLIFDRRVRDVVGHSMASKTDRDPHVRPRAPKRASRGQIYRCFLPEFRPHGRCQFHVRPGERLRLDWVEEDEDERGEAGGSILDPLWISSIRRSE